MTAKAVKARIAGRVQGVSYRAWTYEAARARGLRGWVRNLPDGTVEALFAGPADAVDAMLALCRKGPRAARVSDIEAIVVETGPEFETFEIRYS